MNSPKYIADISQIEVSTENGGVNIIRVTYTDNTWNDFYVRNGNGGSGGIRGSKWYFGIEMVSIQKDQEFVCPTSNVPDAHEGDVYFNTSTSGIYECVLGGNPTVARWAYRGSSRGKNGEDATIDVVGIYKNIDSQLRLSAEENQNLITRATRELKENIFDPDGYFQTDKFSATLLETLMLSVGANSTNFELENVVLNVNALGSDGEVDPNRINNLMGSGIQSKITHFGLGDDIKVWIIDIQDTYTVDEDNVPFDDDTSYYLYIKTPVELGSHAKLLFSKEKYRYNAYAEDEQNPVYYFLVGVLSTVLKIDDTKRRVLTMTYGTTTINGEFIRTGVIRANNGKMEINLNTGEIWSEDGVTFSSGGTRKSLRIFETETQQGIQDANEKVDNIRVGGTNLIVGTSTASVTGWTGGGWGGTWATYSASERTYKIVANNGWRSSMYSLGTEHANKAVCVSFFAKKVMAETTATEDSRIYVNRGTSSTPFLPVSTIYEGDMTDKWQKVTCKTTTSADGKIGILVRCSPEGKGFKTTYLIKDFKVEFGNVVTEWSPSPVDSELSLNAYKTIVDSQFEEIQAQMDRQIENWFEHYDVGMNTKPTTDWTTDAVKKEHIGDLFMNVDNGKSWRFLFENNQYKWQEITNTEASEALRLASEAKDIADGKRRVFVREPRSPYSAGDLWTQGAEGKLMRCKEGVDREKETNTYQASDWEDATSYIDNFARETANTAVNTANSASNKVDTLKIGGVNLQTKSTQWNDKQIPINNTSYNMPIISVRAGEEYMVSYDLKTTQSVNGYSILVQYYDSPTTRASYSWITDAMTTSYKRYAHKVTIPSGISYVCIGLRSMDYIKTYRNIQVEQGNKATSWQPALEDVQASIKEAYDLADTAKSNAEATDNALKAVDSDRIFSTIEKRTMRPQWQAISGVANTTGAWTTSGSAKNVYDNAISAGYTSSDTLVKAVYDNFVALRTYLNGVGLYSDSNFTFNTSYTRAQLSSKFQDYHKAEVALSEATASKLASNAQTNATNNAKTYTDGQVTTLNGRIDAVAQTANNAYSNASQYEYLKQAIAEAESGTQAEGYSVVMSGGAVLSNVLEARNTSGKVTAGVSGLDSDNGDSLAFWAGAERTDGSIPFSVTHSGEVTMSKARITSGSQSGSQVSITTAEGGNVGVISVGSLGGADTEITGNASGGVYGMLNKAGITGTGNIISTISKQYELFIPSGSAATFNGTTFTNQAQKSGSTTEDIVVLANAPTSGKFTFGNLAMSLISKGTHNVEYQTQASNPNSYLRPVYDITIAVTLLLNGSVKTAGSITFNNNGAIATNSLSGLATTFNYSKGANIVLHIGTSGTTKFEKILNSTPSMIHATTSSTAVSRLKAEISNCSNVSVVLNNIIYNDGMFMSRATDRYIAMSTATSGKIMEMVCGQRGMAFTSAQGLGLFARLSNGIDKSKINAVMGVLWYGRFVFNNATISSVENWGGSLSLSTSSIARASSMITITYGVTLIQVPILEVRLDTSSVNDWTAVPRQITTTQCKFSIIQGSNANYTSGAVVVCIKQI